MMRVDRSALGDLDATLTREWLETNGLGGFASSTTIGLNTRRYHGLLVAALKPPVARFVLLSKLRLELRPLIAFRDFHSLTRENGALGRRVEIEEGRAVVRPYEGLPPLCLAHEADEVVPQGSWYRHFEYTVERERGLDFVEDLFNPLTLMYRLGDRVRVSVVASAGTADIEDVGSLKRREVSKARRTP